MNWFKECPLKKSATAKRITDTTDRQQNKKNANTSAGASARRPRANNEPKIVMATAQTANHYECIARDEDVKNEIITKIPESKTFDLEDGQFLMAIPRIESNLDLLDSINGKPLYPSDQPKTPIKEAAKDGISAEPEDDDSERHGLH